MNNKELLRRSFIFKAATILTFDSSVKQFDNKSSFHCPYKSSPRSVC